MVAAGGWESADVLNKLLGFWLLAFSQIGQLRAKSFS